MASLGPFSKKTYVFVQNERKKNIYVYVFDNPADSA